MRRQEPLTPARVGNRHELFTGDFKGTYREFKNELEHEIHAYYRDRCLFTRVRVDHRDRRRFFTPPDAHAVKRPLRKGLCGSRPDLPRPRSQRNDRLHRGSHRARETLRPQWPYVDDAVAVTMRVKRILQARTPAWDEHVPEIELSSELNLFGQGSERQ
jgi:hypothetical protein